jgi:hypothetical protein
VQKDYFEFADTSHKRNLTEDKNQIKMIERIERQIKKPTDLKTDSIENSFGSKKDR